MALVKKQIKRLEIPHEPGEWMDVRVPLAAGDMAGLTAADGEIGMSLDLMVSVVQAWSYPEDISRETIDLLDLDTMVWLAQAVTEASGVKDEAEKKDSVNSSPPTSAPEEVTTPASSGT